MYGRRGADLDKAETTIMIWCCCMAGVAFVLLMFAGCS